MAASDVLVGPVNVWYAPVGTALPSINTVAVGAAWGSGWVNPGMTLTPLSVNYESEQTKLEVEQYPSPINVSRTVETVLLETTLAEFTALNIKTAFAGTGAITTVAAGASVHASDTYSFGGDITLPQLQWGFETWQLDASNNKLPKRWFVYKAVATVGGKVEFSKKSAVGIPLKLTALVDTGKAAGAQLFQVQIVTGWKTS